jgi:hypothetical protein
MCLSPLSDNHSTSNCNIKLECDKLLSDKKPSSATTITPGQLCHITEEKYEATTVVYLKISLMILIKQVYITLLA